MSKHIAAETLYAFRLIVRGTDSQGRRIRRVKVVHEATYESAWEVFAQHYKKLVRGLRDPSYSVLPPIGFLVNGKASTGFEVSA